KLLEEAEQKAGEDRRKRSEIDRRNRAQTLVAQAERSLRDATLELGPYGAERQQRAVEMALRDVQDLLAGGDSTELELAVSQLQEALFGLNRRLMSERRAEGGPLQGLRNTLGSLKDELFAEDDWDDWDSPRRGDPWATPPRRGESFPYGGEGYGRPEPERFSGRSFSDRSFSDRAPDYRSPIDRSPDDRSIDDRFAYGPRREERPDNGGYRQRADQRFRDDRVRDDRVRDDRVRDDSDFDDSDPDDRERSGGRSSFDTSVHEEDRRPEEDDGRYGRPALPTPAMRPVPPAAPRRPVPSAMDDPWADAEAP
ncbi:MAG: Hsp70 family protein, partial [Cyanobium sp.]